MRDGGILRFYSLQNTASAGAMPTDRLVEKGAAWYAYRTSGVVRRYESQGANREYDFVVRCFNMVEIPVDSRYVILDDGTGTQYQIDNTERMFEEDAVDLTLIRLDDLYEVAE